MLKYLKLSSQVKYLIPAESCTCLWKCVLPSICCHLSAHSGIMHQILENYWGLHNVHTHIIHQHKLQYEPVKNKSDPANSLPVGIFSLSSPVFPFSWYNYTYFNTLGTVLQCYWGCFPYFNYKVLSWHSGIALDHPEYFFVCNKEHNLIIPLTYYVHLSRQFWLDGPVTYWY